MTLLAEVDKQWVAVALRRLQELESGQVLGVLAEEVFDRIRKRLAIINLHRDSDCWRGMQ